jgi:hypothetical protein
MKRSLFSLLLAMLLVACNLGGAKPSTAPAISSTQTSEVGAITGSPTETPSPVPPTSTATTTPTPSQTPVTTVTTTTGPTAYGPDNFPTNVNPLTGLKVSDPNVLNRRPMGVKINIVPRTSTRPPFGLTFADIVYDYYHNDGYTRYHAIFLGEDADLVGPIRSGRLPDDSLIRMYKSIFVYGGADPIIDKRFMNADYSNRVLRGGFDAPPCPPTAAKPMCTFEPNGRHNLIASMAYLRDYAAKHNVDSTRQNLNGMSFGSTTPANGKPGTQLYVRYSSDNYNRWDYDPVTGRYMLFQDDVWDQGQGEKYAPLIDRVSNKQVSADNVVIVVVPHEHIRQPPGEIVDILLNGTGTAYAFRDGQMYQVVWNRPATDSVLYLTFPDGTRYPYKPGKTWYQMIGKNSTIKTLDTGAMRFTFVFP